MFELLKPTGVLECVSCEWGRQIDKCHYFRLLEDQCPLEGVCLVTLGKASGFHWLTTKVNKLMSICKAMLWVAILKIVKKRLSMDLYPIQTVTLEI